MLRVVDRFGSEPLDLSLKGVVGITNFVRSVDPVWGRATWAASSTAYPPIRVLGPARDISGAESRDVRQKSAQAGGPDGAVFVYGRHGLHGGQCDPGGRPRHARPDGNTDRVRRAGHAQLPERPERRRTRRLAHGGRSGFLEMPHGDATAGQLVDAARNNPHCNGGPLRLVVCHSGSDAAWTAQLIANEPEPR